QDALAADDALQMLRSPGDSEGEIAAGLDQAARSAHLSIARQQTSVADHATAAFGRAQGGCYFVKDLPIAHPVAGADDEIRLMQWHGIRIAGRDAAIFDKGRLPRCWDHGQEPRFPCGARWRIG